LRRGFYWAIYDAAVFCAAESAARAGGGSGFGWIRRNHDFDRISEKLIQYRGLFLYAQFPTSKCNLISNFEVAIKGNEKEGNTTDGKEEAEPPTEAALLCCAWRANLKIHLENKRQHI
jgi:hypothetical protein